MNFQDTVSNAAKERSAARQWGWFAAYCVMSALAFGLTASLVLSVDSAISEASRRWQLPGDLRKAIDLSEAFAHGFGAAAILAAILIVAREQRRSLVWLAIAVTASSGLCANGLKGAFIRIRPHVAGQVQVASSQPAEEAPAAADIAVVERSFWDARQRSFPSGHAATAVGLAIGLSLLFPRAWGLFACLAGMACLQRITSGAHYPSDVLAGSAIAFLCSAAILVCGRHIALRRPQVAISETRSPESESSAESGNRTSQAA